MDSRFKAGSWGGACIEVWEVVHFGSWICVLFSFKDAGSGSGSLDPGADEPAGPSIDTRHLIIPS